VAGVVFAALLVSGSGNYYFQTVCLLVIVNGVLGMGLTVLFGYAGQLSFAYPALFGVGAYVSALLVLHTHVGGLLSCVAAVAVTVCIGLFVAVPALRLKGLQLGLVTLVFGMAAVQVFSYIGGYDGISGIPPLQVGPYQFNSLGSQIVLAVGLLLVVYILLGAFLSGPPGRRLLLLKADEAVATSLGINVTTQKTAAFIVSSAVLGLIGGVYPLFLSYIGPDSFGLDLLIALFLAVMLGGVRHLEGAIAGAVIVGLIPQLVPDQESLYPIFYGVLLLGVLVALPTGIVGLLTRRRVGGLRAEFDSVRQLQPPESRPIHLKDTTSLAPLLAVTNLSRSFGGIHALEDVSIQVHEGEVLGLVGGNGAGKSTLVSVLAGHLRADSGDIQFLGQDMTRWASLKRSRNGLIRTFQFPTFARELTVRDNLTVVAEVHGASPAKAVGEILERVGLEAASDMPITTLSLGLRKMVDIARAFLAAPRLVLFDEPAAGLSPAQLPNLDELIRWKQSQGVAFLVVEHNMNFILPLAHRVVVLDHGGIIAEGTPQEVATNEKVVAAYLGTAVVLQSS
jgi:ABC-type branched-subunit amino acid transport system ATPase component/ABC-type branched-subunit amino acid transport system permease subunit